MGVRRALTFTLICVLVVCASGCVPLKYAQPPEGEKVRTELGQVEAEIAEVKSRIEELRARLGGAPQLPSGRFEQFERALRELGERCQPGLSTLAVAVKPLGERSPYRPSLKASQPSILGLRHLVSLERLAVLGELGDIEFAQYEKDSNSLLVIGSPVQDGTGLNPDDILTVLQSFFRRGKAPGISIDPGPSPDQMAVRYIGGIENTRLGLTFFEADRLFKALAGGYDNYTCERFTNRPADLLTQLEFMDSEVRRGGDRRADSLWHRLWYQFSDQDAEVEEDGQTLVIPPQRLRVGVEAIPAHASYPPSAGEFAQELTAGFHDLTMHIPALAELHRQVGLVILGWWIYKWRIPVDRAWLDTPPHSIATPHTTPAITVTRATLDGRVYTRVSLYGGIDFQEPPRFRTRAGSEVLSNAARRAQPPGVERWDFEVESRRYRAVRLRYTDPIVPPPVELATWSTAIVERMPSVPVPELLAFPSVSAISQQLADATQRCVPTTLETIVLRGKAYVWDRAVQATDRVAISTLPEELRATASTAEITVFIVQERRHVQVGTYDISGQPAYREDLTVLVHYWPQDVCVGVFSLSADPPVERIVQSVPEYGSVRLSEAISGLRRQ